MNDDPHVHTSTPGPLTPADFTAFMRMHQDMVFSTAARLTGNHAQAEDIAQEVFLKAYARFDTLGASPSAVGWLRTVARNLALNHLQRYRRRWRFFSEFVRGDSPDGRDEGPVDFPALDHFQDGIDQAERRAWLERALAELPAQQRVPLVLFHFEDMSYEEIAERLHISLAKLKTDMLRGRAALARVLAQSAAPRETFNP
jgi:RNA polymerase sigma-70 factor (ECF subfamily)